MYANNNPVMFVDPMGFLSILPDGTVHANKNDSATDIQLLKLKIQYRDAHSDEQRAAIAAEAEFLRKIATDRITVLASQSIEEFYIVDVTEEINKAFWENGKEASEHALDPFWFRNMVNHNQPWDVKRKQKWEMEFGIPFPSLTKEVMVHGEILTPEDIGNMMYGYTGTAAAFPAEVLFIGGGIAANGIKYAFQDGPPYYSDSVEDHNLVKKGIDWRNGVYR